MNVGETKLFVSRKVTVSEMERLELKQQVRDSDFAPWDHRRYHVLEKVE